MPMATTPTTPISTTIDRGSCEATVLAPSPDTARSGGCVDMGLNLRTIAARMRHPRRVRRLGHRNGTVIGWTGPGAPPARGERRRGDLPGPAARTDGEPVSCHPHRLHPAPADEPRPGQRACFPGGLGAVVDGGLRGELRAGIDEDDPARRWEDRGRRPGAGPGPGPGRGGGAGLETPARTSPGLGRR